MPLTPLDAPPIGNALNRRSFLVGTGMAALLAGCAAPAAPPSSGPTTRVITTALGDVSVPSSPQQVVALGSAEADTAVALGVVPVAVARAFGASPYSPWLEQALAGQAVPIMDLTEALPLEQIAAAEPDVILAPSYTNLDTEYGRLSEIAPVVGYLEAPFVDTWQEQALLVGQALGRDEQVRQLIADVDADLAARAARHPAWAGRTLTYGLRFEATTTRVFATQQDKSMFLFTEVFGLSVPAPITQAGEAGMLNGTIDIGPERLDLLEADALLLACLTPQLRAQLESDPLFNTLDVVRRGAYAPVELSGATALREPSLLSLPFATDDLENSLTAALG